MKFRLNLFTGSSLTVYNDGNFSATTCSPSSSLAKNDKSTLTITPNTGKTLDTIEVITGGCEVINESGTWKVKMGESDAIVFVKGKTAKNYLVTEECSISINGTVTALHKNAVVQYTPNGVPKGVTAESGGTVIADSDAVTELIAQGILVVI